MAKLAELTLAQSDEKVIINLDHVVSIKGERFNKATGIVLTVGMITVSEDYDTVKELLTEDD